MQWIAESAVSYHAHPSGPETYRRAIDEALASGQELDGLELLPQFDQTQLAGFLRAVGEHLDALRPWPEPAFRIIDPPKMWEHVRSATAVAAVDVTPLHLMNTLRTPFRSFAEGGNRREALTLRLRTGETVSLLATFEPTTVSLLADERNDPATVIDHFLDATAISPDNVTRL